MRYLVATVVCILIFLVPFGSWYYLQSGLDYRKAALKELEPKGNFDVDGFSSAELKSKTTLFHLLPLDQEIIPEVYDQYKSSATYQLISIQEPSEKTDWLHISDSTAQVISTLYNGVGMILVDTSGVVRNTYANDKEGVSKMIEHTSIILPRVKEIDIKMKSHERK